MRKIKQYIIFAFLVLGVATFMGIIEVEALNCVYDHKYGNTHTKVNFQIENDGKMKFTDIGSVFFKTQNAYISEDFKASNEHQACPDIYFQYVPSGNNSFDYYVYLYEDKQVCESSSAFSCSNEYAFMVGGKYEKNTAVYTAKCLYKSKSRDNRYIKINYDSRNTNPYVGNVSEDGKTFYAANVKGGNTTTFPFDEGCPTTIQAEIVKFNWWIKPGLQEEDYSITLGKGETYANISKDSVLTEELPTCSEALKEDFKKEEQKLFNEYLKIKNEYIQKIKNKEINPIWTTAEEKIKDLQTLLGVPAGNFEKVYKKNLDKLRATYKCKGMPDIIRGADNDKNGELGTKELQDAYDKAIKDLLQEAKDAGNEEDVKVFEEYISSGQLNNDIQGVEDKFNAIVLAIEINWDFDKNIGFNCSEILGNEVLGIVQEIFDIIKIIAPILLILFGIFDYAKAVLANDNDAIKKSTINFIKRTLAAVAIFFLPLLINLILSLPGIKSELNVDNPLCDISKVVQK